MAEASRVLIGLVCGLFILSAIPHTAAQEELNLDSLVLEFDSQFKEWYEIGEVVDINPKLTNFGDQISISNDPSCDTYFEIKDSEMQTIFENSANCREQDQQLVIETMETINFQSLQWDFTDSNGNLVPSGEYNLYLVHSKTNLRIEHGIYFQQSVTFDSNLELELDLTTFGSSDDRDGHHLIGVTLSNPTDFDIALPTQESCKLIYSFNAIEKMLTSCYGGNLMLHPHENSFIDGIFLKSGELLDGQNVVTVTTPGGDLVKEMIIQNDNSIDSNYANLDDGIIISTDKNVGLELDHISFLSYSLNLENTDEQPVELNFPNSCIFEMYIVNDLSELIFDTSQQRTCQEFQTSHTIQSGEVLTFDLPEWYLEDENNCYVDSGAYTIILEIPQYSVTSVDMFDYTEAYRNPGCSEDSIDFESEFIILDELITASVTLSPSSPIVKINEQCVASIYLTSVDESLEFEDSEFNSCGYKSGNYFNLPIDSEGNIANLYFESNLEIPQMMNIDSVDLLLLMEHNLEGEGSISHSFTHTYDYTQEVFKIQKWQMEGLWTNIGTGQDDCWMISNNEESYLLVESKELPSWSPQNNWKGDYLVSESSYSNVICQAQFDLNGIEIHSVYSEEKIVVEEQAVTIENEEVETGVVTPEEIAKVTIVVVSTTSVFAILSLFVINTESLRIPTTAAGLWLLGLLGKTQETNDGRFQRGRLMGYLTANPGCHFRALMAALGMSNGQITHHLRLLEQQELIWRLRDGRLVRYYPLNNSLYPGMNPENLPIPPLSPDPNSLQGKILSLLDDEHQYGKFPTQAELAIKLEKSQQLISHHLRTLQKFGLVEKRKMGIKNRYKLTKEALFLLETDIDFKE